MIKELQKSTTREVQKGILKEVQRYSDKPIISINRLLRPPIKTVTSARPFSLGSSLKKSRSSGATVGYLTFIKRFGKIKLLSGIREKGTASRFGETVAKKTLAATFGIKKTNKLIKGTETTYTPDSAFRNYKIKEGHKYKLDDTFIQRLGKRLSSSYEVSAIQRAKTMRFN